ncbi:penicillin acylase family protein, partial [Streptomyces tricolor]
ARARPPPPPPPPGRAGARTPPPPAPAGSAPRAAADPDAPKATAAAGEFETAHGPAGPQTSHGPDAPKTAHAPGGPETAVAPHRPEAADGAYVPPEPPAAGDESRTGGAGGSTGSGGGAAGALALRYPPRVTEDLGFSALLPLLRSRTVADLDRALDAWSEPVNVVQAADTAGGTLHRVAGHVPARAEANRLRPVPAWEPGHAWHGAHETPYADPAGEDGIAVMANARGLATPLGVEFAPPHRAARIRALLDASRTWTADGMPAIHTDTHLGSAAPLLDHLAPLPGHPPPGGGGAGPAPPAAPPGPRRGGPPTGTRPGRAAGRTSRPGRPAAACRPCG